MQAVIAASYSRLQSDGQEREGGGLVGTQAARVANPKNATVFARDPLRELRSRAHGSDRLAVRSRGIGVRYILLTEHAWKRVDRQTGAQEAGWPAAEASARNVNQGAAKINASGGKVIWSLIPSTSRACSRPKGQASAGPALAGRRGVAGTNSQGREAFMRIPGLPLAGE